MKRAYSFFFFSEIVNVPRPYGQKFGFELRKTGYQIGHHRQSSVQVDSKVKKAPPNPMLIGMIPPEFIGQAVKKSIIA